MLTTAALVASIGRIAGTLQEIRDRLNDADSRLGDGDTGMTVARMIEALQAGAAELPPDVGAALVQCGRACSRATGSSFGAVVAMALSAAGRATRGQEAVDRAGQAAMLAAAAAIIQERSGATPGDKTVLDSILAIQEALSGTATAASLRGVALDAAESALERFRGREARLGRARMYGAKSMGLDDPGMLAVCLILKAAGERAIA
jgi:dihydroxyacetone kinase